MNAKENSSGIVRAIVTFATLVVAGVVMVLAARGVADALDRQVLVSFGSSLFGGSLAFFLVEMFRWDSQRRG